MRESDEEDADSDADSADDDVDEDDELGGNEGDLRFQRMLEQMQSEHGGAAGSDGSAQPDLLSQILKGGDSWKKQSDRRDDDEAEAEGAQHAGAVADDVVDFKSIPTTSTRPQQLTWNRRFTGWQPSAVRCCRFWLRPTPNTSASAAAAVARVCAALTHSDYRSSRSELGQHCRWSIERCGSRFRSLRLPAEARVKPLAPAVPPARQYLFR